MLTIACHVVDFFAFPRLAAGMDVVGVRTIGIGTGRARPERLA